MDSDVTKILRELADTRNGIMDLEVVIKPLRKKRDALIVAALRAGASEWKTARAAGTGRAWIYQMKKRNGLVGMHER